MVSESTAELPIVTKLNAMVGCECNPVRFMDRDTEDGPARETWQRSRSWSRSRSGQLKTDTSKRCKRFIRANP